MKPPPIFSVSELTSSLRGLLELHFRYIAVSGEISNLHQARSGHWYFVLKDAEAQLRAVLFRMQQRYLAQPLADGQMVVCRGRLTVYEQRGEYQLLVDSVESAGAGALHQAYEALKHRLAAEGLFAQERKRTLPLLPERLVLVTSPRGAVVHDFLRIAHRRCPVTQILIYPVAVQGAAAAPELAAAVADINRRIPCDFMVLCRGGGSIEDFWAYNEEVVVRAVAASKIPVVSAVGHDVDVTICDYVADVRAPTPSAAAELVLPDIVTLRQRIHVTRQRLERHLLGQFERDTLRLASIRHALLEVRYRLDRISLRLDHLGVLLLRSQREAVHRYDRKTGELHRALEAHHPLLRLHKAANTVNFLEGQIRRAMQGIVEGSGIKLGRLTGALGALSPLATLARGYAIVLGKRGVLTASIQTSPGETLQVRLHQGSLSCSVLTTSPDTSSGLFPDDGDSSLQPRKTCS